MLLRKSLVAMATLDAASEWRGHMGSTTVSTKHAVTTVRMEGVIDRKKLVVLEGPEGFFASVGTTG